MSSGFTPRVSQIHLNYESMQDKLVAEQEDHRETRESVNVFNAFMAVRNKNTFITF
jgi:hypothetical protein